MAALDRHDIVTALQSLFQADTTVLYGKNKLINSISIVQGEFEKATVDLKTPYKMFLRAISKTTVDTRSQNKDYEIAVEYLVRGAVENPETALQRCDDIDERIEYLVSHEMWGGHYLTSYYTNSECTIVDIDFINGENTYVNDEEGRIQIQSTGVIRVVINRIEP